MDDDAQQLVVDEDSPTSAYSDKPPVYSEVAQSPPTQQSPPPPATAPPVSTSNAEGGTDNNAYASDELPPPYTPHVITTHINCKVCCHPISLDGRQNLHVVKCSICNEATPIKNAPPGKKYVRCPCNCLLICSIEANRIVCPRINCQRIICIQQPNTRAGTGAVAGYTSVTRVQCAYCNNVFMFQRIQMPSKLAHCTSCRRISFVGPDLKRKKLLIFCIIGALFLVCGGIVTGVTVTMAPMTGVYFVWIGAFVVGVLNLIRAAYWASVKVSTPLQ